MKPELQAKFLQHLNRKKRAEEGFTLIELLVVIIIIGILAAIALPSLLGQVNKARQAEAKNNVGALNRAQQAYQLEYSEFETNTVTALGVGIRTQTENYSYDIVQMTVATPADPFSSVANRGTALPGKNALKSYAGLVATVEGDTVTGEVLTVAAACESKNPTQTPYGLSRTPAQVNSNDPCSDDESWKSLAK